jgi:hypothetical protein
MEFEELVSGIDFFTTPEYLFNKNKLTISQNEMLKSIHENPFTIIYKRRQEGVSTAILIYLMWLLITKPGYSIGFLYSSQNERENFRQMINMNLSKIEKMFENKGLNVIMTPEKHNTERTILPNGSRISYFSKNSKHALRGYSVDFIYISEMAFKDNFIEIISSLFPLVALKKNGKFVITTTELRNIKDDFQMNGDGIQEHWCDSFFDGRRFVIVEKYQKY